MKFLNKFYKNNNTIIKMLEFDDNFKSKLFIKVCLIRFEQIIFWFEGEDLLNCITVFILL
jgi:hypothetical protein